MLHNIQVVQLLHIQPQINVARSLQIADEQKEKVKEGKGRHTGDYQGHTPLELAGPCPRQGSSNVTCLYLCEDILFE